MYTDLNRFSARQHICYSALYAIARPSVCPSVCLSHGWITERRLKLGSRNLHHRVAHDSSFLTLDFTAKFRREDRERGRRISEGYEKYAIFSQLVAVSQKRCKMWPKLLLVTNRKSHFMRFRLVTLLSLFVKQNKISSFFYQDHRPWMTLNSWTAISSNFLRILR